MNPADTKTGGQLTMTHKMLSLLLATIWGATVALATSPQTASDLTASRGVRMAGRDVTAAEPTAEPPTAGCDTRSGEVLLANNCCAIRGTSPGWAAVLRSEVSAIACSAIWGTRAISETTTAWGNRDNRPTSNSQRRSGARLVVRPHVTAAIATAAYSFTRSSLSFRSLEFLGLLAGEKQSGEQRRVVRGVH